MSRKKVTSIAKNGEVKFLDIRTGKSSNGTKADCLSYGYNYKNSKCYAFDVDNTTAYKSNLQGGNRVTGKNNTVQGNNNKVKGTFNAIIGNNNTVQAQQGIAIGNGIYVENKGVIALGNSNTENRARFSLVNFTGTTTNASATELYIGGYDGVRFIVNDNYESAFAIDYTATALNAAENQIWTEYGHVTYKYTTKTLEEVGHQTGHIIRDSQLDYDITFNARSSPVPYIEVSVQGEAAHTAYWNVILKITEVRYG